jgi:hypothetical protein
MFGVIIEMHVFQRDLTYVRYLLMEALWGLGWSITKQMSRQPRVDKEVR